MIRKLPKRVSFKESHGTNSLTYDNQKDYSKFIPEANPEDIERYEDDFPEYEYD